MIILGGIFGGVVTATEGAALAVLAALFIGGVIYRELDWKHLYRAMIDGATQTATVMLLVAASALLGVYLTEQQIPQQLAQLAVVDHQQPLCGAGHPERVLPASSACSCIRRRRSSWWCRSSCRWSRRWASTRCTSA